MAEKTGNRVRLSIDVEPELRRRVKIAAARHDQSVRDYVEDALRQALERESETNGLESDVRRRLTPEEQERGLKALAELERRDQELLRERGGRIFSPSWELLDEAREERTRRLMGEE